MVSAHGSRVASRQLTKTALGVAWAWSAAVLIGVGVAVITGDVASQALVLGAVPLVMCGAVDRLVSMHRNPARRIAATCGVCLCSIVLLLVMLSSISPALLVAPTCVALIAACSYRM